MASCCSRSVWPKCQLHKMPFESISLNKTDQNLTLKACRKCLEMRKIEQFISYSELDQNLKVQQKKSIAQSLTQKIKSIKTITDQYRGELDLLVDQICKSIKQEFQNLFVNCIIKQLPNEFFTASDVLELMENNTIIDFENIFNNTLKLNQINEKSLGLLAKVMGKEQQANEFLNLLPKETDCIKDNLQKVSKDCEEIFHILKRSIDQSRILVNQLSRIDQADPALQFLSPRNQVQTEKIAQIERSQALILEINELEKVENPQIKYIIEIDSKFIAYCSGTKIIIIEQTKDHKLVQQIDCESDVTSICSIKMDNKSILVSSVEEQEDLFQLIFWDWQNMDKIKVINAHQKYIWKIINLPQNWLATCSDDKVVNALYQTIKIYDDKNIEEKIMIAVHDAQVNDIALINRDIIISVSDDKTVAASNFKTGETQGLISENCEIKCVVALDGINFVTGNSDGELRIYIFTDKIQMQNLIKFHSQVVRFISRIDYKTFVTASWDGTNIFANVTGEKLNQILEGSKKNFSEPLLWAKNRLWASIGGQLHVYQ